MPNPPPRERWKGPGKPPPDWWNDSRRPHGEHLSKRQVDALVATAAELGRHGERDATIIRVSFVHGLRVSEATALLIEQYDFHDQTVRMVRSKKGKNITHPVDAKELKAIKGLIGDRRQGPVFLTERGTPFDVSSLKKIVARAGRKAKDKTDGPFFNFPVHFHMLRHACGYWMNDQGHSVRMIQDWLGHRNIRHTERYTANSPEAFKRVKWD
jgi:type 1 fimbriae regulatory protein FimB/type 1 fimbriae regulatory protein FimE